MGAIVRVPLGGRRVRGYVVETGVRDPGRLKPVAARSGNAPVFGPELLDSLIWASKHYVAPLSVVLERAAPPNNPTVRTPPGLAGSPLGKWRTRPRVVVGRVPDPPALLKLVGDTLGGGGSVMVVVPTAVEARDMTPEIEEAVVVHGDLDARQLTAAWARCQSGQTLLVGTPRVAAWQVANLELIVVVDDGRRAMKDRQTPTIHARDLVRERSKRESLDLVVTGPTPSVESVGWGSDLVEGSGRPWSLVEVVDRRDDPPGRGLIAEITRRAIQAVVAEGGSVFLFAHRRGHAAASRCIACRRLRICGSCGARLVGEGPCERCQAEAGPCPDCGGTRFEPLGSGVGRLVEEAGRVAGGRSVGAFPSSNPVQVGTERDLVELDPHDLVVMVDLDGLLFASNYRAAEEALRIGARLAGKVKRGRRMIVQTQDPDHPVVRALQSGSVTDFLRQEVAHRGRLGYPPSGELLVVEARGPHDVREVDEGLRAIAGEAMVMGPAAGRDGSRWLVQGRTLDPVKSGLRDVLRRLRDAGVTVRVDSDPIDL